MDNQQYSNNINYAQGTAYGVSPFNSLGATGSPFTQTYTFPQTVTFGAGANMATDNNRRKLLASSITKAFQVIFHYEGEATSTQTVKGVENAEAAEELFLSQFDEEKHDVPNVVAVVAVTGSY